MLTSGPALRVVIHLNEDTGSRSDYLHLELISFLYDNDVSGATVFRPHAGFGVHHAVHIQGGAGVEGEHLPIRIEFVESRVKVESLLPRLYALVTDGMIEAQETTVLKIAAGPQRPSPDPGPTG